MSNGIPVSLNITEYSKKRIKEKHVYTEYGNYLIWNHEDTRFCHHDISSSQFASIIFSYPEKKILCYSPAPLDHCELYQSTTFSQSSSDFLIHDVPEGVMINLFYDERIEQWEISTKSGVGGRYRYDKNIPVNKGPIRNIIGKSYIDPDKKKNFYRMFLDALRASPDEELNDVICLQYFPKNLCYSFILQHPKNHICLSVKNPKIYLMYVTQVGACVPGNIIYINPNCYQKWDIFQNINMNICFPRWNTENTSPNSEEGGGKGVGDHGVVSTLCRAATSREPWVPSGGKGITEEGGGKGVGDHGVVSTLCRAAISREPWVPSIMVTDLKTGLRYFIESKQYRELCIKKGRQNNMYYTYLCLLRIGKAEDYLYFFPKYKKAFRRFETGFNEYISNIYESYVDKYISKMDKMIKQEHLIHIYKLHHEIYLPSLNFGNIKRKINKTVVRNYLMKMEPHVLLWFSN